MNKNWSILLPSWKWLWWITFKHRKACQIILCFFIINDFYRFINSCITPCIPFVCYTTKELILEWLYSDINDPHKPNIHLTWSSIYGARNCVFFINFNNIIVELLLSLHIFIAWLYKSLIALNIKLMYGLKFPALKIMILKVQF